MIINLELEWHRVTCIMVSLDIHVVDIYNTIRELLSIGIISIDYVKSKDNITDLLTKGLNIKLVEKSSRGM